MEWVVITGLLAALFLYARLASITSDLRLDLVESKTRLTQLSEENKNLKDENDELESMVKSLVGDILDGDAVEFYNNWVLQAREDGDHN